MADVFAEKTLEQKLTLAEIMGFVMNHRLSPEWAIDNVGQCIETLQERE